MIAWLREEVIAEGYLSFGDEITGLAITFGSSKRLAF